MGAGTVGSIGLQKQSALKNTLTHSLIAVPTTYLYAGKQESKVRKGEPIGKFENLVRKHPFLTSLAAIYGIGKGRKFLTKSSSAKKSYLQRWVSELDQNEIDSLYEDLVVH